MDSNRFYELARSLATGRNRRSVLKAFGAIALGAAGVVGLRGSAEASKQGKVGVCTRGLR